MMQQSTKRILCGVLSLLAFCTLAFTVRAVGDVTPTTKWYEVDLNASNGIFLSNLERVNMSSGEAVYLSYTVDSVVFDESTQHGIITTSDREAPFPYDGMGYMEFNYESILLKEGYTYFIKMQVTAYGLEYAIAYANETNEDYIVFTKRTGDLNPELGYCGIWFAGGKATAKLSRVHSYDKNGNDLGISVTKGRGATVYDPIEMQANSSIEHSYEFYIENEDHLAISNARYSEANVVYMEYTVKDAINNMNQTGLAMTNSPTATVPHAGNGAFLRYNHIFDDSGSILLIPNATYLIRFERTAENFEVLGRYTLNGEVHYFTFDKEYGSFDPQYGYFTLWFGEGKDCLLTAKFENFKCYDANGNNLAVQTNKKDIEIIHYGGLEDYSKCEAVYYCKENDSFIALYEDRTIRIYADGEENTRKGTYSINGLTLTAECDSETLEFQYLYTHIKNADGYKYIRLKENTVTFVVGEERLTQTVTAENFFKAVEPSEPSIAGNHFKCWCTGDGVEYNFDQVVTKALTLYAKWNDGNGNEYISVDSEDTSTLSVTPWIIAGSSALIIVLTVYLVIAIKRGAKKNEKKPNTQNNANEK